MIPKGDRGSKRALFLLCREGTDGHPTVRPCCTWHEVRRSWANGGEQRKDCLHWLCARRDFLSELIGSWFPRDEKGWPRNTGSVRGDRGTKSQTRGTECANASKHDLSGLPKGWGLGKSQNPESSLSWGLAGCCEEHDIYHGNSKQLLMEREGGHKQLCGFKWLSYEAYRRMAELKAQAWGNMDAFQESKGTVLSS